MIDVELVEGAGGEVEPNMEGVSDVGWYSAAQIKARRDGLPSNHQVVDLLEAWRRAQ